jgi:signal recognition particle subunit SRP54
MFDQLSGRLQGVFDKLNSRGLLTESDVDAALREVRLALLEADVALPVVKRLINQVKEQAVGEKLLKSVKPGEQVIKLVHDAIVDVLGAGRDLELSGGKPAVIVMMGLQGSGKTTTAGKVAKRLKEKEGKSVLLASLDIYRPAAREQLQTLAERTGVDSLSIENETPEQITKRALKEAAAGGHDVLILDTAGRLELDDALMSELKNVVDIANPSEKILVADALSGQVAAKVAQSFHESIGVTGITLTRIDGDGRGGAAFSMREVTGQPVLFLGAGEGLDALELFDPDRIANRILGMGDVVALVEKMQDAMEGEEDDMLSLQEKMFSGKFDLNDLKKQMKMMRRMGSMKGLLKMMPGVGKMMKGLDASKLDDKIVIHQMAIIDSMTRLERKNPQVMNARRRARVAKGAGLQVSDVNKLLKNFEKMQKMMKQMQKMGGMGAMMQQMQNGGGNPFK